MYTAKEIAKWIIHKNKIDVIFDEEAEKITNLKLQKLLYYMQGVHLAYMDTPLFSDEIHAWKHGPVVDSVYRDYSGFKGSPIDVSFSAEDYSLIEKIESDTQTIGILNEVYDHYNMFSAWGLRNMTHNERPWIETDLDFIIKKELIKEYFKEEVVE